MNGYEAAISCVGCGTQSLSPSVRTHITYKSRPNGQTDVKYDTVKLDEILLSF